MNRASKEFAGGHAVPDAELIAMIGDVAPAAMRATRTPGLSVAVTRAGKLVWEGGFGFADVAAGEPMTERSLVPVGSLTKLYTVVAVMQLVEQGLLGLHQPVADHLRELNVSNPLGEREVTPYDLMTFRGGLGADLVYTKPGKPEGFLSFLMDELSRDRQPGYGRALPRWPEKVGERYLYSNLGFALLARLVERLNKERLSFGQYVRSHVMEPLGMQLSAIPDDREEEQIAPEALARLAHGYARFGEYLMDAPFFESPAHGAVGLLTVPGEHIRLLVALMQGGRYEGCEILTPVSVRLILSPQVRVSFGVPELDGASNGLGFEVGGHGGELEYFGRMGVHPYGWWTVGWAYPRLDAAVCVFSNKGDLHRWYSAEQTIAPGVVAQLIAERIARGGSDGREWAGRTDEWVRSYVMGLVVVERLAGVMEIPKRDVRSVLSGVPVDGERWDRAAFEAGVDDMLSVEMTPDAIRAFLHSGRMAVRPELVAIAWLSVAGRAAVAMPLRHWSGS